MVTVQAGGGATTGRKRVVDLCPENIHQRIPFAIGSLHEIEGNEKSYANYQAALIRFA